MPRKRQPARLYWHPKDETWIIRDGTVFRRTGCGGSEYEGAKEALEQYIAEKWVPKPKGGRTSDIDCATVIMLYFRAAEPKSARPRELLATCERLNAFWGNKAVNEIVGDTCREYTKQANGPSAARRDLAILSASVNMYARENVLDYTPKFTTPPKETPRTEYLTRSEAARMILNAHRMGYKHLVRYLIIGLYSGSRSSVITGMQWMPNTTSGYFDLERGIMYRSAPRHQETNKRKRPATIPKRLMFWLKRWFKEDSNEFGYVPHVIRYRGKPVKSVKKTWKTVREMSGISPEIVPHSMRHSSITWAMQGGVSISTVASFYSVSIEVLQNTYWHHHPEFQEEMREVF